jgi:hypothetical protein
MLQIRYFHQLKLICVVIAPIALLAGCGDPSAANNATSRKERTDEVLVAESLDGTAGEAAVTILVQRTTIDPDNPTREHLRKVFRESESAPVRVAAIKGIAKGWDYDAMEDLFEALDDPSLEVRERAGRAVNRMLGLRFPYNASDPPVKRALVVSKMRETWGKLQSTGRLDEWLERLPRVVGKVE